MSLKLSATLLLAGMAFTSLGLLDPPNSQAVAPFPVADSLDALKVVYLGSSVPFGQGATNKYGYPSRYGDLLRQRHAAGLGAAWTTANASVPGDNTVKVLARWRRDLLSQRGRYVVLALSLGNEGVHERGAGAFAQFEANMRRLVAQARAAGRVPVVTNCYGRGDFTAQDYAYVRRMNLLLHTWDVPTVNLLGAVDDGQGHWASGYWDDAYHPNDRGHAEMACALVPSLFDALAAGKPLPHRQPSGGLRPGRGHLTLVPEATVHAFTQAISFQAAAAGRLLGLRDSLGYGQVQLDSGGRLTYHSARGGQLASTVFGARRRWHQATLTHYFARGETVLYLDGTRVGSLPERLHLRGVVLGGPKSPPRARFRNWLFYRAGMNRDEVRALAADSLLRSSLELYAPLDGPAPADAQVNLAQSTNRLLGTAPVQAGYRYGSGPR